MKLHKLALTVAGMLAAFVEGALVLYARTTAEQLFRPMLRGPLGTLTAAGAKQFAGRTAIASGDVTNTVSTTIINSDSLVFLGVQRSGTAPVSGSIIPQFCVASIVSNVSFAIVPADNLPRDFTGTVMWEIRTTS